MSKTNSKHGDKAQSKMMQLRAKDELLTKGRKFDALKQSHDELLAALKLAAATVTIARKYFPKSMHDSDKFQLEQTCAAIGNAFDKAKATP